MLRYAPFHFKFYFFLGEGPRTPHQGWIQMGVVGGAHPPKLFFFKFWGGAHPPKFFENFK